MQLMQYKKLFLREARTKLKEFEDILLVLEKKFGDVTLVGKVLTLLHSLKSYAATMSYLHLANAIHTVEAFFIGIKKEKITMTRQDIDQLFVMLDTFRTDLSTIEKSNIEIDLDASVAFLLRRVGDKRGRVLERSAVSESTTITPDASYAPMGSYVEVSAEELDQTLRNINEIIAAHQQLQRRLVKGDIGGVKLGLHNVISQASDLRESIVTMKMIPVKQYFFFLARLVRDLARTEKKFITFDFNDNNLRFERHILESLREICIQLVKNAVTHAFKEGESGKIRLAFEFKSGTIYISVTDNGHGIDWKRLHTLAETQLKGRVKRSKVLSRADQRSLLFDRGISTTREATLVSGRGIGLPLVYQTVTKLQGEIEVASHHMGKARGARFDITIPLTATLFRALTWRWGPYYLALPLFVVEKVIQLPHNREVKVSKTYRYRSKNIPIFELSRSLGLKIRSDESSTADTAVVVRWEKRLIVLMLPAGVSEQELILKALDSLKKFPMLIGAAVSEESVPVIILNHRSLFE